MTPLTLRRLALLLAIVPLAGWVSLRLQFHALASWSSAGDEFALAAIALVASVLLLLVLIPASIVVERFSASVFVLPYVLLLSVAVSFGFGLWVYAGLLPRSLAVAVGRDLPYVAAFCIFGAGYFLAYWLQRRIWPPHSNPSQLRAVASVI